MSSAVMVDLSPSSTPWADPDLRGLLLGYSSISGGSHDAVRQSHIMDDEWTGLSFGEHYRGPHVVGNTWRFDHMRNYKTRQCHSDERPSTFALAGLRHDHEPTVATQRIRRWSAGGSEDLVDSAKDRLRVKDWVHEVSVVGIWLSL